MTIAKNIQKLASRKKRISSRAYRMLKACGNDAVPQLIAAFESPDFVVRYRVAMLLGKIGDRRALQPLIAHTRDAAAEVRYDSAMALGYLGDRDAVPFLIDLMLHPIDDTHTDGAAFASLVRFGEKALPPIREALASTIVSDGQATLRELETRILDPWGD